MSDNNLIVKTMAEWRSEGEVPEVLFWVGCAGSYDSRAQKVSVALSKILNNAGVTFGILGDEEACTGDPARRAGNEFVFQMMAFQNIAVLNDYNIQKIVTACPHCFNTLKNEYPDYGGNFEVIHHSQLLQQLIDEGRLTVEGGDFKGKRVTYHDSCYLGRANDIYEAPRLILEHLDVELTEMKRCKSAGLCCGAGGAQMFKEDEPGNKRINIERSEEAVATDAGIIAVNCPFCMTMIQDGVKALDKNDSVMVYDLAELIVQNNKW